MAQEVRLGDRRITPPANVEVRLRGVDSKAISGRVLVQVARQLSVKEREDLARKGLHLGDYLGGRAYAAKLDRTVLPTYFRGSGLRSVIPFRPEWKLAPPVASWHLPEHSLVTPDVGRLRLYTDGQAASSAQLRELDKLGVRVARRFDALGILEVEVPRAVVRSVVALDWVLALKVYPAPQSLVNLPAGTLGRGNVLRARPELGGRGLTGAGVRVGIWDADVLRHFDFTSRLTQVEMESQVDVAGGHGMHVTGTVGGGGLIDPDALGIAPGCRLFTHNFDIQSNGLNEVQEMYLAAGEHGISLSQNSYGTPLPGRCYAYDDWAYDYEGYDFIIDALSGLFPDLTQVYAAGNDQGACGREWGHILRGAKNVIHVAAVDDDGVVSPFSSFGPLDDGRLAPTVSARGVDVYSTFPDDKYGVLSGTSMACPVVTGHLALLSERYARLHSGAMPRADLLRALVANTADEAGLPGPDFRYGYGILNAEHALESLEHRYFSLGVFRAGDTPREVNIPVPVGATRARVMLVWNDTVSRKQYAHAERALINDLDLSVVAGSKAVLPLVLDPERPEQPAAPGVDRLNNMEQCVLELRGEASLTATITPTELMSTSQDWALVWFFDRSEAHFSFPLPGECFVPGERFVARLQGAEDGARIQLSYDGGATFTTVSRTRSGNAVITLSPEAKPSPRVKLRALATDGTLIAQSGEFVVAPRVEDLSLREDYGTNRLLLSWTSVEGAVSYDILRADEKTGAYERIVQRETPFFTCLPEWRTAEGRNAFAVVANFPEGFQSKRSHGVISRLQSHLATVIRPPFYEFFPDVPPSRLEIKSGTVHGVSYEAQHAAGFPAGANVIEISSGRYDPEDQTTIELRQVDLSGTSGIVLLKVRATLFSQNMLALFRNVTNPQGELQPVQIGKAYPGGGYSPVEQDYVWDLSDLPKDEILHLSLYIVGRGEPVVRISGISLAEFPPASDGQLLGLDGIPLAGRYGARVPATLRLRNASATPIEETKLVLRVNGRLRDEVLVPGVPAWGEEKVDVVLDLSTEAFFGEALRLEAVWNVPGDMNMEDNRLEQELVHLGRVFTLDEDVAYGDPVAVRDSLVITDKMGLYHDYQGKFNLQARFVPATPGRVLQIEFQRLALSSSPNDRMEVYTMFAAGEDPRGNDPFDHVLRGQPARPFTLASGAEDGALTLRHINDGDQGEGFLAIIREVRPVNTLRIHDLRASANAQGQTEMRVKLTNLVDFELRDVDLALLADPRYHHAYSSSEVFATHSVPRLAAGETVEVLIPGTPDVDLPVVDSIWAQARAYDMEGADNIARTLLLADSYCPTARVVPRQGEFLIQKLQLYEKTINFSQHLTVSPIFHTRALDAFDASPHNVLRIELLKPNPGSKLAVYVDWNGDLDFADDGEALVVEVVEDERVYELTLDVPQGLEPGSRRMRVVYAPEGQHAACGEGTLEAGDVRQLLLDVHLGLKPGSGDMELVDLQTVAPGRQLDAAAVSISVRNLGEMARNEVPVHYRVNGGETVTEILPETLAPFGGEARYTFEKKVDVSNPGPYEVEAWIDPDAMPENNSRRVITAHVLDHPEARDYYLQLGAEPLAGAGPRDGLHFSDNLIPSSYPHAVEFWMNLDPGTGIQPIFQAGELMVLSTRGVASQGLPENGIAIIVGDMQQVFLSLDDLLKPGSWQHFVFNFSEFGGVEVSLVVDGEDAPLYTLGNEGKTSWKPLVFGYQAQAKFDNFRFWKGIRLDRAMARRMMNRSIEQLRAEGESLVEKCIAEFTLREGPTNIAALGSDPTKYLLLETVNPERGWVPTDRLWRHEHELVGDLHLSLPNGQVQRIGPNSYRIVAFESMDRAHVELGFTKLHPAAVVYFDGALIEPGFGVDFSRNPVVELEALLVDFWGFRSEQRIRVELVDGPSDACHLLSLSTDGNAGLAPRAWPAPVPQSLPLRVVDPAQFDRSRCRVEFTLPQGARAKVGGRSISSPAILDLSQPVTLVVSAENGINSTEYVLWAEEQDRVDFDRPFLEVFYGDRLLGLPEKSVLGRELVFIPRDMELLSPTPDGVLAFGVGETQLEVRRADGIEFETPLLIPVRILPRGVRVRPIPQNLALGQTPEPLRFAMEDPAFRDSVGVNYRENYQLMVNGQPYDPAHGELPVGEHSWVVVSPAEVHPPNYRCELLEGSLSVTLGRAQELLIQTNVPEVEVRIDGRELTTGQAKELRIHLLPGEYSLEAEKDGYASQTIKFIMWDEAREIALDLMKRDITCRYTAGSGGTLLGETEQRVARGESTREVLAVSEVGFVFDRWSDGVEEPDRIDANVSDPIDVQALFKVATYPVTYAASLGGKIQGASHQEVPHGQDASLVEALPDFPNAYFVEWSDGQTEAQRTDRGVTSAQSHLALFGATYQLPHSERFNSPGGMPPFWLTTGDDNPSQRFEHVADDPDGGHVRAVIRGAGWYEKQANLLSPRFEPGASPTTLTLRFKYKTNCSGYYDKSQFYLRTEDGDWELLAEKLPESNEEYSLYEHEIAASELEGKAWVQFRWTLEAGDDMFLQVDDFELSMAEHTGEARLLYVASSGGKVNGQAKVEASTPRGTVGPVVEAQPDAGNVFLAWSDGLTEAKRQDDGPTSVVAYFAPDIPPAAHFDLTYRPGPGGWISGALFQNVPEHGNGAMVLALADVGYEFRKWSDGRTDNPRQDKDVTATLDVTAEFSDVMILTYGVDGGPTRGSIDGPSRQELVYGQDAAGVTAVPADGMVFLAWSDGLTEAKRQDLNVTSSAEYTAVFAEAYALTYTAGPGGILKGNTSQNVTPGMSGTPVLALAKRGFQFVRWSDGQTDPERTDSPEGNLALRAEFAPLVLQLDYLAGPGGSIDGQAHQHVDYGASSQSVAAVPALGFRFVRWDDGRVDNPRRELRVTANLSTQAEFDAEVSLSYTIGQGGVLNGETHQTVPVGGNASPVEVIPDPGWHFTAWSDGSLDNPRIDRELRRDLSVEAICSDRWELTYTAGPGGTIQGDAFQQIPHGGEGSSVTAQPAPGYKFVRWSDGLDEVERQDLNVTSSGEYTAMFARETFTVTATTSPRSPWLEISGVDQELSFLQQLAYDYGRITPASQEVPFMEDAQPVRCTPSTGISFLGWEDGEAQPVHQLFGVTQPYELVARVLPNVYEVDLQITPEWGSALGVMTLTPEPGATSAEDRVLLEPLENGRHSLATGTILMLNFVRDEALYHRQVTVEAEGFRRVEVEEDFLPQLGRRTGSLDISRARIYVLDGSTSQPYLHVMLKPWIYTVTYSAGVGGEIVGPCVQNVPYQQSASQVVALPSEGYGFEKWSDDLTEPKRQDRGIERDMHLEASFRLLPYTVVFKPNGGIGEMEDLRVDLDGEFPLPECTFVRQGFDFLGWDPDPYASTPAHKTGDRLKNLAPAGGMVTLYAIWNAQPVGPSPDPEEPVGPEPPNSVDGDQCLAYRLVPNPTSDFLRVDGLSQPLKYAIFSTEGTRVQAGLADEQGRIDVRRLPAGLYILRIDGVSLRFVRR